jgi:hypothetical protein
MDEKDVAPGCRENVFCQLFAPSNRRLAPFEGSPASMTMLRTQWLRGVTGGAMVAMLS